MCHISRMFCSQCGKEGIPIPRKESHLREKFHKKWLYCPSCKKKTNHIECRTEIEITEFLEEFAKSKMKRLYILCGIPGAGKSTWVNKIIKQDKNSIVISRDKIRFSMLNENDEYFAKEKEVWEQYVKEIKEAKENNIYLDATHLNRRSRDKIKNCLNLNEYDEVNCIFFDVNLNICLSRNRDRVGRAFVPEETIKEMHSSLRLPTQSEKFTHIYIVNESGDINEYFYDI